MTSFAPQISNIEKDLISTLKNEIFSLVRRQ